MQKNVVLDELSEREIQILNLLNEGLTNQEIATRIGLTLYTVKWYLKQIYGKLYVANRTQAASKAREMGLITTQDVVENRATITSYMPAVLTPFFGREQELDQIQNLLHNDINRLITLHGTGGMGKTRLALEISQRFRHEFENGVFFVSLGHIDSNPLMGILETLELTLNDTADVLNELSAYLKNKKCLILLDNFEHLTQYASHVVSLLERTKYVKIIVTSREVLHVQGEFVVPLSGLTTQVDTTAIASNGAYQLFIQRARSGFVDFVPNDTEKMQIAEICNLLGGMPLAIEIAAGWASVLSIEDTLNRLKSSFDLLKTDERNRPERQQSIQATLDYSWNLLSPESQQVLLALSVFNYASFPFDAAQKIAGATPEIIKQLLDTALLQRSGHKRFIFHPIICQYVMERLQADNDLYLQYRTQHGEYYFDFVMSKIKAIRANFDFKIIKSFLPELFNLRIAWHFAVEQGNYEWLEQAVEVGYLCDAIALWQETDLLFETTAKFVPKQYETLHARLLAFRAIYAFRFNNLDNMRRFAIQSWDSLRDTQHAWDAGTAMAYLALGEAYLGDPERGLDIMDDVELLLQVDYLGENLFAYGAIHNVRAIILLITRRYEEALPLLQNLYAPNWHEAKVYLPICYLELGLVEEARTALEALYNAGLDNKYYTSVVYAVFYLCIIDSEKDSVTDDVANSLMELSRISGHFLIITKLAHYQSTLLMIQGSEEWSRLLSYSILQMLYTLDEFSVMYQYAYKTAQLLEASDYVAAMSIYMLLTQDVQCPIDIQQEASSQITDYSIQVNREDNRLFLDVIKGLLINNNSTP
jgi:predicted ATPase/DNA-binding CsgD family transcriptional regulator